MKHGSSHFRRETIEFRDTSEYKLISRVGAGTFGAVFKCQDSNGNIVAIKKVCLDPRYKSRELSVISSLNHPNCLRYIDHYNTKEGSNNETFLHLVTDYFPRSLVEFGSSNSFPNHLYVKLFGFQLFAGLANLHAHGICHRDIKPSNVLVDDIDGRLQICDFGSAKYLREGEESVSYIATRSYRAPELLLDCRNYTFAIDVWAAGCVIAEMYKQGKSLFNGINNQELLKCISRIVGSPKPSDLDTFDHKKQYNLTGSYKNNLKSELPQFVPQELIDLLNDIFTFNPKKRPSAAQCMKHPFFSELFKPDAKMPGNGRDRPLPSYLQKMRTPEEMFKNFPAMNES